ncbi:MAG: hypothetical protein KDD94_14570, partial [Calditrichaeota bacterium]|nr:hypothetical protein [Calditrichota bacterium]
MLKYLFPLLLLLSCSSPIDKQETIHNFQLRLDLSQLPASVASIRGQLSNSNSDLIVFNFDLDTITETATAIVSEIPVGEWQLTVNAMDENEIVTHSASVTVLIHSGLNEVNLIFEAVTGDLVIHAGFQIELNEENTFLYEYHAEDDSLYLQTGYDIDSLISIYEPR